MVHSLCSAFETSLNVYRHNAGKTNGVTTGSMVRVRSRWTIFAFVAKSFRHLSYDGQDPLDAFSDIHSGAQRNS